MKTESGFTLIELIVVISIIGILSVLVIANLGSGRAKGRDAGRKSDLKQISSALEGYYSDNRQYPPALSSLEPTYIGKVPTDPLKPNPAYGYALSNDSNGLTDQAYRLSAEAENAKDPDKNSDGNFYVCGGAYKDADGLGGRPDWSLQCTR